MNRCHLCHEHAVDRLRDFGPQPVCNRFLAAPDADEQIFPMVLGQCNRCGTVQLMQLVPSDELRARFPWITYTEPSTHLDWLVQTSAALPGISKDSRICGIFLPTDPTLARFEAAGFTHTWRLDCAADLGVNDACAGTETIQGRLDESAAEAIAARRGQPDLIVARHILEHTHDPSRLMRALHRLVNPRGYVIFEVPDCQPALEKNDYTTLWEEHVFYFTAVTLAGCLEKHGWRIVHQKRMGPSLVAFAQPAEIKGGQLPVNQIAAESSRAKAFAAAFPGQREAVKGLLSGFARERGKIAVFGAGHLSCVFINLMELKDVLFCVIDDHDQKQGRFMPGSRLPIHPSRELEKGIALCLSSLGPETDARLSAKNPGVRAFLERGGEWRSLLPGETHLLEAGLRGCEIP
jgi:hypothetical protein